MTREEARQILEEVKTLDDSMYQYNKTYLQALDMAIKALEQEPCEDTISRQAAIVQLSHNKTGDDDCDVIIQKDIETIKALPSVNPQPKTEQFAKWVAREIFNDMWEYNKDAFAELACRKLAKLGIVRAKGDEWELVDPQERSDKE